MELSATFLKILLFTAGAAFVILLTSSAGIVYCKYIQTNDTPLTTVAPNTTEQKQPSPLKSEKTIMLTNLTEENKTLNEEPLEETTITGELTPTEEIMSEDNSTYEEISEEETNKSIDERDQELLEAELSGKKQNPVVNITKAKNNSETSYKIQKLKNNSAPKIVKEPANVDLPGKEIKPRHSWQSGHLVFKTQLNYIEMTAGANGIIQLGKEWEGKEFIILPANSTNGEI